MRYMTSSKEWSKVKVTGAQRLQDMKTQDMKLQDMKMQISRGENARDEKVSRSHNNVEAVTNPDE